MITEFLEQDEEIEAFITGPAGSGKTTYLRDIIETLNDRNTVYKVVAYTHKAKDVLIEKLPEKTDIVTLHSWLKKRPGINEEAEHIRALMTSHQRGKPEMLELLIVDEFSFVSEKDYMSIGDLQDELNLTTALCKDCGDIIEGPDDLCGELHDGCGGEIYNEVLKPLKVLYVGDLNQLSPVNGPAAVYPRGPFWEKLTTIHRTTSDISKPLKDIVDMIEGIKPMKYLEPTNNFLRRQDIDKLYKEDEENKVMLAFTNEAVQRHNITIQGYSEPKPGDLINVSTLKLKLHLKQVHLQYMGSLQTVNGIISTETKYSPVQYMNKLKYIKFYEFTNGMVVAGIFGSYNNKTIRAKLGKQLVNANKNNKSSKKFYREYKVINDFVATMEFDHCMTIHKSQGSEYDNVYVDSADLAKCINRSEMMKLLYVAMSRAKNKIFLNN